MDTGHPFEFQVLPDKRAIHEVLRGDTAISVYHNQNFTNSHSRLITLAPPIDKLAFWWWTGKKEHCKLTVEQRFQTTGLGITGSPLYEELLINFENSFKTVNANYIVRILISDRAQFSFWPIPAIRTFSENEKLFRCDSTPYKTIHFYAVMHQQYAHLQPLVETALGAAFTNLVIR